MDALRRIVDRPRAPLDAAVVVPLLFYHYSVAVGLVHHAYVDPTLGRVGVVYYGAVGVLAGASVAGWRGRLATPGVVVAPVLLAWPWVVGGGSVTDGLLPTAAVVLVPVVTLEALVRRRRRLERLFERRPARLALWTGAGHFLAAFGLQLAREPRMVDFSGDAPGHVAFVLFVTVLFGLVHVGAGGVPVAAWYRHRLALPGVVLAVWLAGGFAGVVLAMDVGGPMAAVRPLALDPTDEYLYRVVPLSVLVVAAGALEAVARSVLRIGPPPWDSS